MKGAPEWCPERRAGAKSLKTQGKAGSCFWRMPSDAQPAAWLVWVGEADEAAGQEAGVKQV